MSQRWMRHWVALCVLIALTVQSPSLWADVQKFAVFIGSNRGNSQELALEFAETDAERLQRVLHDVGGFLPENTLLLRAESATAVQRALIAMNDRVRAAKSLPGAKIVLLVYYSGHADARALHLGDSRLELELIEQLVRSSAADFRILIVDACRSGALTRAKGGTAAPPFVVQVERGIEGEGTVFLAATSANEDAQESPLLGGSFFTHYFRSGLLGPADSDSDGQITLDEAYRYAYSHTLTASSRTLAGLQHPTYRYELSGQNRIVLASPGAFRADRGVLAFPESLDFVVLARDQNGAVAGEVSAIDKNHSLSLPPGRYFLRGRGPRHLLEGTVEAKRGETTTVRADQLERVEYARLARKGSTEVAFAQAPIVGYSVRAALKNSSGLCQGGFAGYALALRYVGISARFDYCHSGFENNLLTASVDAFGVNLRGAHTWDVDRLSLQVGASLGAELLRQRFQSRGFAPPRTSLGGRVGLDLGVAYEFGAGFFFFGESAVETHWFSVQDTSDRSSQLEASLAFRQQVGLGKWF